jgi:amino acid adenylation domain-containing protein
MSTEIIEGFRLSPQQEHLWLLQQATQSSVYRVSCSVLVEGNLEDNYLLTTLENIIKRHEIFRTNFEYVPGMTVPVQVIANSKAIFCKQHNLSDYNVEEQEVRIAEIFQEFNQREFDLEKNSPLHTSLVKLSPVRHILLMSIPALYGDKNTLSNLVSEICCSYKNSLQNNQIFDEPLQYADFSEWQNELIESEKSEIGREYWRKQDLSNISNLQIPGKIYVEGNTEFKPEIISLIINPDLTSKIQAIAQKYQSSTSELMLACWSILLWRLTQQPNIIIGQACDGRKYQELKESMGLFARYLPLACQLADNLKFSQFIQQISQKQSEIKKWQECFVWELTTNRDSNYSACFDFEEIGTKYANHNLSFSIYDIYSCIEKFKIKLSCLHSNNSLIAKIYYDTQLFSSPDIESLSEQFLTLLESVTINPEANINELQILSDRVQQQILVEFNQTQATYPQEKCIHELFEEQVQQIPNNIAVVFDTEQITYNQLNTRANQLANYLQQIGILPGMLVGICVERSLEMIVGILGILKAGAAYVPIDATYPQERITWILENSQTPVLLTQQALQSKLATHSTRVICLDTDWEIITQQNPENPPKQITPNDLAYIIYTSGSTGKPKGVQITHSNLVHSTTARINYYQGPISCFLLLSSFAFDSSVAGIFWTICTGGTLLLPQAGLQLEIAKLIELISQHHVSHLLSLPSLYTLILQQAKPEQLENLHTIIVAGESCSPELLKIHQEYLPAAALFNEYGPTEATVWSSVYHYQSLEPTTVPIGKAITNTQIYILDPNLRPVPIGVHGEIYIGGEGIALGYLNQPELTREKFISNPFNEEPSARLYKTGDLARYRRDGNIEFLGRIDHQVKIRGYRIELGEIEAALKQHSTVDEVVVAAIQNDQEQPHLIAYIVVNQQMVPSIPELRNFLQKKLPEYMLPSAFMQLKALPILANGKVNYGALPKQIQLDLETNFVAPESEIEQIIANIWKQVLQIQKVGIHHNFFDLGGHSLAMVQVHAKLRETLNPEISMVEMFAYPTVNALAKYLSQNPEEVSDFEPNSESVAERKESNQQQRQLRQKNRAIAQ